MDDYCPIRVCLICPYCMERIETGQSYELAVGRSPIEGMTIHSTCARQREFARESNEEGVGNG